MHFIICVLYCLYPDRLVTHWLNNWKLPSPSGPDSSVWAIQWSETLTNRLVPPAAPDVGFVPAGFRSVMREQNNLEKTGSTERKASAVFPPLSCVSVKRSRAPPNALALNGFVHLTDPGAWRLAPHGALWGFWRTSQPPVEIHCTGDVCLFSRFL